MLLISFSCLGRRIGLLDGPEFFGSGFDQAKGHVRVISNEPVVSFALFGSFGSEFLSAIEGQKPSLPLPAGLP